MGLLSVRSSSGRPAARRAARASARRLGARSAGTRRDFQVGAISYLYGTRFFGYLGLQYGPESLIRWVSRDDGSRAYFASQFRKVFGRPLPAKAMAAPVVRAVSLIRPNEVRSRR